MPWMLSGIYSWSDSQMSNLSGKPTFWERPFKGRLGGGFGPEADAQRKKPSEEGFSVSW